MASLNPQALVDALTAVSSLVPQIQVAMTAYSLLKRIWLVQNPGKTEDDYFAYLDTWSKANVADTAALLMADGYIETTPGKWEKQNVQLGTEP